MIFSNDYLDTNIMANDTNKHQKHISKFLSLVLRHKPETIHLKLDSNGWADVNELLQKCNAHGIQIDAALLADVVANNNKKRFAFNQTHDKIRANQGHSIDVDVELKAQQPPDILYHGTAANNRDSILKDGLQKQNRLHVHLSADIKTAKMVGSRHGKPMVFEVDSLRMHQENHVFYLSENGVWLTEAVPSNYLTFRESN